LVARIYALIFLSILVFGFIYQESYMQMSMSEFSTQVDSEKFPSEVFSMSPVHLRQYDKGELVGELIAAEGKLVTTGKFTAQGGVRLYMTDPKAPPQERLTSIRTPKLIATTQKSGALAIDLFSGGTKFERVEFPAEAEIFSRAHKIEGNTFAVDIPTMTLVTKKPVKVSAANRTIEAQGVEVELRTRAFKFAGPVRGVEIPPATKPKERVRPAKSGSKIKPVDAKGR
jgi:hypothetical protein